MFRTAIIVDPFCNVLFENSPGWPNNFDYANHVRQRIGLGVPPTDEFVGAVPRPLVSALYYTYVSSSYYPPTPHNQTHWSNIPSHHNCSTALRQFQIGRLSPYRRKYNAKNHQYDITLNPGMFITTNTGLVSMNGEHNAMVRMMYSKKFPIDYVIILDPLNLMLSQSSHDPNVPQPANAQGFDRTAFHTGVSMAISGYHGRTTIVV